MKSLIDSGASAITLHLRYTDDRPRVPCHAEFFSVVQKAMKEYAPLVPICYNGDIFSYEDVCRLREQYPQTGLMIGRGAILDMGVFNGTQTSYSDTNREFMKLSAKYNNCFANVKYTAFRIITEGKHQFDASSLTVQNAHDWETLGSAYGVGDDCVSYLEDIRSHGLEVDSNIRTTDVKVHRKNQKRNAKKPAEGGNEKIPRETNSEIPSNSNSEWVC